MDSSASDNWAKYGSYWASTQYADDSSDRAYIASTVDSFIIDADKDYAFSAARSFTQF